MVAAHTLPEDRLPAAVASAVAPDLGALVRRLPAILDSLGQPSRARHVTRADLRGFVARVGWRPSGGPPELVVGPEVALELGHPETASEAAVLWTREPGRVDPGRVSLHGPDLGAMPRGTRRALGILVALEMAPGAGPDPYSLERALRLTDRLPGYMVRALPGRLWARIGATRLDRGLSLLDVGEGLVTVFRDEVPGVIAAQVLLVTASRAAVQRLAPVVAEAQLLAGRLKKLTLAPDGALECEDLHCEGCEEREVCDALRDVLSRRRRRR